MTFLLDVACELKDAGHETPLAGLQHPPLDIGEAREVGVDEFLERLFRGVEPPFDLVGRHSQGRGVLVAGLGLSGERVPEKGLPSDAVRRGAVGRHEGLGLAGGQGVTGGRIGHPHLGPVIEGAELQSQRHRKPSAVEPESELRREAAGEGEATVDPRPFTAEELGDRGRGEIVIVGERGHDPGLVHWTRGLPGSVRGEDPGFHGDAGDRLLHHGDLFPTLAFPEDEPLEAVDDLEPSVRSPGHPQRHGGQVGPRIGMLPAERGEGGTQLVDGYEQDEVHRLWTSTGRT
jgi:hypothetical protein